MRVTSMWGGWLVVALLIGCAPATKVTLRTEPAAYQQLSQRERAVATAKADDELARAQQEVASATQELAAVRQSVAAGSAEVDAIADTLTRARSGLATAAAEDQEDARHEMAVAEAGVEVVVAKQAWLAACERWRLQIVEAAQRHVVTADAAVELARAQALSRHDSAIEVERYRGQYARLHKLWSEAQAQVRPARRAVDSLEALQTRVKGRYAELKSIVLPPPVVPEAPPQ